VRIDKRRVFPETRGRMVRTEIVPSSFSLSISLTAKPNNNKTSVCL
jgi:hypothetical protein